MKDNNNFNTPTYDQVRSRIQSDCENTIGLTSNNNRNLIINAIANSYAGAVYGVHGNLKFLSENIFVSSANNKYLDKQLTWRGIYRKTATYSKGIIRISGNENTIIPQGLELVYNDELHYITQTPATIGVNGFVDVEVQSAEQGLAYNQKPNTILKLSKNIAGLNADAIVQSHGLTGGQDSESDEDYRARGKLETQKERSVYGKKGDWAYWIIHKANTNINRVFEVPNMGNNGVLALYCMVSQTQPSDDDINKASKYLQETAPSGILWDVRSPIIKPIDFTMDITPNNPQVQQDINTYTDLYMINKVTLATAIDLQNLTDYLHGSVQSLSSIIIRSPTTIPPLQANEINTKGTITFKTGIQVTS